MADSAPPPATMDHPSAMKRLRTKLTTVDGWVGSYDYVSLCTPRLPCLRSQNSRSIFFGLNDDIPILVAMLMGFQHALAMVGGVITVPRLLGVDLNFEPVDQAYLISTSLVVSGLMTIVQILRFRLVAGYYIGTGLISVSGVSFTFLPIARAMFRQLCEEGGAPCRDVYGQWLGTIMVGALLEIALSFIPHRALRKAFPPLVTGVTVFLIGASLVPVGLSQWAGSSGPCKDYRLVEALNANATGIGPIFEECPIVTPDGRSYPWGAPEWIGLGFFVFVIIVLIELFGSPFFRNTQVFFGLISGIVLAAVLGYLNESLIDGAPVFTFPLVRRFNLGFYAPAIIPVLIGYVISAVETVGDIAASCEASRVQTEGEEFESRVQGGLLADGLNSLAAGLLTSSPTTTFSQNNGVIVLTRTASRVAGLWAATWLLLFGVLGKVGGVFVAIPDAVLGGMTTFLFANVAVSGMRIIAGLSWDRRERFILAISLGLGIGVIAVPAAFKFFLPQTDNSFAKALKDSAELVLTTGYSVGGLLAMLLNWVIPKEEEAVSPEEYNRMYTRTKEKMEEQTTEETPPTEEWAGMEDDNVMNRHV